MNRTLIVANHESFLDGLLLGAFLPMAATFVVHAQVVDNRGTFAGCCATCLTWPWIPPVPWRSR